MKKYLLLSCLGLIILGCVSSQDKPTGGTGIPKSDYKKYCASCHGDEMKTFIDRKWRYGNSWNEVFNSIKFGNDDDGMPAYKEILSDKDIRELTDYILKSIEGKTKEEFKQPVDLTGTIQSEEQKFRLDTVVTGLSIPWGMAFLPDGMMLITDRDGQFYSFKNKKINNNRRHARSQSTRSRRFIRC